MHAQVLYGSLTGNVTDPSGGAVPGAKVEVLNAGTGIMKHAITSNAHIVIPLDKWPEVSPVAQTITVSAEALALQTDRAGVSAQLESSQVSNLPIGSGRNFQQLYKLIPGASPPADAHSDA